MSIQRIIIVLFYFLLIGCAHQNPVANAKDPVQCRLTCQKYAKICTNACNNNAYQCNKFTALKAKKSYCAYQREQLIKGGFVARDLQSYRDQLQCRKITCNCFADYNVCMQSCNGKIYKELTAPGCQ